MEFPVQQIREFPADWTLKFRDREWHFQDFWIRSNSGTARAMPKPSPGAEQEQCSIDLTEQFADFDFETFDKYHAAVYRELALDGKEDASSLKNLWILADFMD